MKEVRKVYTLDDLKEVLSILERADIEYKAKEKNFLHDNIYTKNLTNKEYVVLVNDDVEQKALNLFATYYSAETTDDNFLLKLDNEDLVQLLAYQDEYSVFEINESKAILVQRGIAEAEQRLLVEKKIAIDNSPQKAQKNVIIGGYAFVLIGGIFGFAMGWFLYSSKAAHKITGETYKAHDNNSRFHGLLMLVLGSITTFFYLWFGIDWWGYFIDP